MWSSRGFVLLQVTFGTSDVCCLRTGGVTTLEAVWPTCPGTGPRACIVKRLLALNACTWHNWLIGGPRQALPERYDR